MSRKPKKISLKQAGVVAGAVLLVLILGAPSIRLASNLAGGQRTAAAGRLPAIIARARQDNLRIRLDAGASRLTEGAAPAAQNLRLAATDLNNDINAMDNLYRAAQTARTPSQTVDIGSQLANVLAQISDNNAFARAQENKGTLFDRAADTRIAQAYHQMLGAIYDANVAGHQNLALMLFGQGHGAFGRPEGDTSTLQGKAGQFGHAGAQVDGGGDFDQTAIEDTPHLTEINYWIDFNYINALYWMLEQFTSFMTQQIGMIGGFMDAENQLDVQREAQDMDAAAHKDYEPSTQMCIIGTNARSLAMSDQKGKANAAILSNTMLERSVLAQNGETGGDNASDMASRKEQYIRNYCEGADNSTMLKPLCGSDTGAAGNRRNRDIDYEGLINSPLTLDTDFTDTTLSNDEEDVLAMSRNLFANNPAQYIPAGRLLAGPQVNMGPGAWLFQDMRSLQAIRGVAENSFAHIVGMKSKGGDQIYPFASQIIKELGVTDDDLTKFIGQNPSYFAQMDILTKRIEMAPDFYVNLFTSPANVNRMGVTLQAIKLMNDRDRFESSLRREMLISLIVELKIRDAERPIDNKLLGALPTVYTW